MDPVDLFRRDGFTAYSHDVQVDDAGIAWVSGDGGTRGYTSGVHWDSFDQRIRRATPLDPIPYAGGGLPESVVGDTNGGFEHNAWRPVGRKAPKGDPRYRRGELLLATEEDFGPPEEACSKRGQFTIASLKGSYGGRAWLPAREQVPARRRRQLEPVPAGGLTPARPVRPARLCCPALRCGRRHRHVRLVRGGRASSTSPTPRTRPGSRTGGRTTASSGPRTCKGYIYTADRTRGVDVLKLTGGARPPGWPAARCGRRRHRRASASSLRSRRACMDRPGTAGLCLLQTL